MVIDMRGRKKVITRNQIKNFAHSLGIKLSDDAKEEIMMYTEKTLKRILLKANEIAKHRKRKVVDASDIRIILQE